MKLRSPRSLNRRKITGSNPRRKGRTVAQLNVNTADLLRAADTYTGLADRTSQISPQAHAEVQRITATHGPMGYPAAVGIATALANAEKPLNAKAVDFQTYSQRFTEHAATYTTEDREAAQRYRGPGPDMFAPANAVSGITLAASGGAVIVFCVPTPGGFRCTNLFSDDRSVVVYPSPTDRTGAWLP